LGVDAYLDARLLCEHLGVLRPLVLIALDEALPAQHAQLRAFLGRDLVLLRLRVGGKQRRSGTERPAGSDTGCGFEKIATLEFAHGLLLKGCCASSRCESRRLESMKSIGSAARRCRRRTDARARDPASG